jgi:GTP-binding protein
MTDRRPDIRNVAIIAHVDHGKTTLLDALLRQAGVFHAKQQVADCVMDSKDQERERGITILAKNCAVTYADIRINLIDTPGHADFGGEVERVLRMADGVLLLVDAMEGAMPQTRFVLRKAIENKLKPIVIVNKIDKPGAKPKEIPDQIFDLMVDLGAEDWQLDFPVLYGSGRGGFMNLEPAEGGDLRPLFDAIIEHIPGPPVEIDAPLQLQVANIDHNDFVGRMAIGRIYAGSVRSGMAVSIVDGPDAVPRKARILQVHRFAGLGREEVAEASAGDIVIVSGIEGIDISDTICDPSSPKALPPIPIDEPTIKMTFGVNTSPLTGTEGKPLQSRDLKARLMREAERNVALRVADTEAPDVFEVSGRGILHLGVLIEDLRREGSELQVGSPRVIYKKDEHGNRLEPIELAVVDVPEPFASKVMQLMLSRRSELVSIDQKGSLQHLEFTIPARGLIGLKNILLTATQGEAILNTLYHGYEPYRGDIEKRQQGAIISMTSGEVVAYALFKLQDRGEFFVGVNEPLYEGQVIGENAKDTDMSVNLTTEKKLTNVRSSGADEAIRITPPRRMSLEESMEYIRPDELVEVTPKSIRLRKQHLKENDRKRASRAE